MKRWVRYLLIRLLVLACTSSVVALASEDQKSCDEQEELEEVFSPVDSAAFTTLCLGSLMLLPSFLMDMNYGTLSHTPVRVWGRVADGPAWLIFGPGYWLAALVGAAFTQLGDTVRRSGLGGEVIRRGLFGSVSDAAIQVAYTVGHAIDVANNGYSVLDYLSNYLPWLIYAYSSGYMYGTAYSGIQYLGTLISGRISRPRDSNGNSALLQGPTMRRSAALGCTIF